MPSAPNARVIRFWKPYNVLTQFTDPEGRSTLADYIPVPNVYATGRLDMDSEGLLLLTDSALLKTRLTEPVYAHPRTYYVQVERIPSEAALQQLRLGVLLNDGPTRPAKVELIDTEPDFPPRPIPIRFRKNVPTAWLRMTLTEGRNRQVRRMTAAVGFPTLRIIRTSISAVMLDGLHPGEWLDLTMDERKRLWQAVMPG